MSLRTRSLHPILDHLGPLTRGPAATAYEDLTLCLSVIPAQALSNVGQPNQLCFWFVNAWLFHIGPLFTLEGLWGPPGRGTKRSLSSIEVCFGFLVCL